MLSKRRFLSWTFGLSILLLLVVLIATNPSEQMMIESFVDDRIEQLAAHAAECEECSFVPKREQLIDQMKVVILSEEINYRSYYLFSVLKTDSMETAEANLFGALGRTFLRTPMPAVLCLKDVKVELPTADFDRDFDPATSIEIEIAADGSCRVDGEDVSLEELVDCIRKKKADGFESVICRASKKTKYRDLDQVKLRIGEAGITKPWWVEVLDE